MDESRSKATQTRLRNLREKFQVTNGRFPTEEELILYYKQEMQRVASLSSRNSKGTGGFAFLAKTNPEYLRQITSKGGSRTKNEKISKSTSQS